MNMPSESTDMATGFFEIKEEGKTSCLTDWVQFHAVNLPGLA